MKHFLILIFAVAAPIFVHAVKLDDPLPGGVIPPLPPGFTLPVSRVLPPSNGKFSLTIDKLPALQLLTLFYDQCENRGLVFDPAVNSLESVLTIKTQSLSCAETKIIVLDALTRAGVFLDRRDGYDVAVQTRPKDEIEGWQELIYQPRFRDPLELVQLSSIAIRKGRFAHQRQSVTQLTGTPTIQPPAIETGSNGASLTGKRIDKLVFFGPPIEVKAVESLLTRLDSQVPQVEIRAGIYEFQSGKAEGGAVNVALSLFSSRFGASILGGTNFSSGASLKLSLPGIDAALSVLDKDSRFTYVSQPKVTVGDGEQVSFVSGQDVRVDGSVTLTGTGQSVASKTTLTAGVSLSATPHIRGEIVDVSLNQQFSDFVVSPNNDPSVMRRQLTTRLSMEPGQVYVIGGLNTNRKSFVKQSFFGYPVGVTGEKSDTEVLLLLSVQLQKM